MSDGQIVVSGLTKQYKKVTGRGQSVVRGPTRSSHRVPRAERRRQDHDAAYAAQPRYAHRGHRHHRRAAVRRPSRSGQHRRGGAGGVQRAQGPLRAQPSAGDRGLGRPARQPGRRGARTGRAHTGGEAQVQGLLAGHAPASRHRRRTPRRPARAHPRRARQRPRPRGHPLDARPAQGPRDERPHGPGVQPPALRDADPRRRPGHHRRRPAGAAGVDEHGRRLDGDEFAASGSARRTRRSWPARSPAPRSSPARTASCFVTGVDAPAVGAAALGAGVVLHELVTDRPDLERVFLELTQGKAEIR